MQKIEHNKKYWQAVAVMIGYIVGVGMFSLPFVTAQSGLLMFFVYLIALGFIQYFVHLVYANMIVATKNFHRLPGYVGIYLGEVGKTLVAIAKLLGNYGALLAYIIISGSFLHELLGGVFGGTEFFYGSVIFILEAVVVFYGIGMIARFELVMTGLLFVVVFLMFIKGNSVIEVESFKIIDWRYAFLPYGAMLMALDGNGSLPIVAKLLKKDVRKMKSVIRVGMIASSMLTVIFVLTIVGISGENTTENALSGVNLVLSDGVVILALIFGVITMMTSVFGVAESIKETLWWDYKVNKNLAWALAVSVPYILYVLGFTSLIGVIGFAGAVAGGFCAVMMILTFMSMRRKKKPLLFFKFYPGNYLLFIIIFLMLLGVAYEVRNFIV